MVCYSGNSPWGLVVVFLHIYIHISIPLGKCIHNINTHVYIDSSSYSGFSAWSFVGNYGRKGWALTTQHSHPQRAAGQASCDLIAREAKVKPWGISASLWERKSFFSIPAASTPISYFLTLCLKTATLKLSCNPETIFYFTEYYPFFFYLLQYMLFSSAIIVTGWWHTIFAPALMLPVHQNGLCIFLGAKFDLLTTYYW